MSDIQVGDVVYLRSGGPAMTVDRDIKGMGGSGTQVACLWFINGEIKEHILNKNTLTKYNPSPIAKPVAL